MVGLAASCAVEKAQRGGKATHTVVQGGRTNRTELMQSENPKEPSTQTTESTSETKYVLPAGARVELPPAPVATDGGTNWVRQFAILPNPVPVVQRVVDRTSTSIGAAQKDTARALSAQFANMRPVMYFGLLMLCVAGAFAYFGWWTKCAIFAVGGLGAVFAAQVVPGNEWFIMGCAIVAAVLLALLVLYSYNKGAFDQETPG